MSMEETEKFCGLGLMKLNKAFGCKKQTVIRNGKKGGNGVSESRMQTGGIGLSLLHHVNI